VKCPLCLDVFGRDALETGALTLEHPIPRKTGGRLRTLSCKRCNNKHGSRLDSHSLMLRGGPTLAQATTP